MRRRGRVRRRVRRDRRRALAPGRAGRGRRAPRAAGVRPERERDRRLPAPGRDLGRRAVRARARRRGDRVPERQPGRQRAVNRRGLRFHTVVSCGNQAVLEAADFLHHLVDEGEVRSVALNLEADGDGARLCEALAACADAGIGVAVLKVGRRRRGRPPPRRTRAPWRGTSACSRRCSPRRARSRSPTPTTSSKWPRRPPCGERPIKRAIASRSRGHRRDDRGRDPGACCHDLLRWRLERGGGRGRSPAGSASPFSAETERRLAELVPPPRRSPTRSTTRR